MPSFVTPANGDDALAEHVAQLTENFSGLRNIPIQLTGINDPSNYAQTIKNVGAGSKDIIMYAADGTTVLFQVDANGVRASASGGAAAPIATTPIATADLADRSVTNAKLAADTARANLLTNGGFEIWQRGNGPFTTNGSFIADRWGIALGAGDTLSCSRDTSNADVASGASVCAAVAYTKSAGPGLVYQSLSEGIANLRGRTITFSARVKTSSATSARVRVNSGSDSYSSYHTGDGAYQTLSVTHSVAVGAAAFTVYIQFDASGTYYVDNAMLVVGSVAADYAPLHPADDLARCLRYYERIGDTGVLNSDMAVGAAYSTSTFRVPLPFQVVKAVTPTITSSAANNYQAVTAAGAPSTLSGLATANVSTKAVALTATTASASLGAGNAVLLETANIGAVIGVEGNP